MEQRFRPDQRIRDRRIFQFLFKNGRFVKGDYLNLWVYEDLGLARPQLGVIVSRKTESRATRRNLWKRRIREAFRRQQGRLKKLSVMIQSRPQDSGVPSYAALFGEMEKLFEKTSSFKNKC